MNKNNGLTIRSGGKTISIDRKPNKLPVIKSSGSIINLGETSKVDITFVFDTTGSMSNVINILIKVCSDFVTKPKEYGLNAQLSLISFGDLKVTNDRIDLVVPLTSSIGDMKQGLADIPRNYGGGNLGESSFEAIAFALDQVYRSQAINVLVLITDEPAHRDKLTEIDIHRMLQRRNTWFYAVAPKLSYFKNLAAKNMGEWQEISSSSNLNMLEKMFENMAKKMSQSISQFLLTSGNTKK